MSPIDPRELGHNLTETGTFDEGYRCVKCNYDLTGLPRATVCPECGTANSRPIYDKKRGTGVSRAPIAFVNRLGTWLWAAAFALLLTWFTGMLAAALPHPVTFGLRFLAGVGWVAALWMATHPKPDRFEASSDDLFDNPRMRLATIIGQSLWLVTMVLNTAAWFPAMAPYERILGVSANIIALLAAAGFIPLGLMLASLANWMGDHDAESRCGTASWLIAFYGVGILLAPVIAAVLPIFFLLYFVFWIAYLAGVVLLAMSLFNLARAANWAVQNARHKSVVSGRRAVIERQQAAVAAASVEERLSQMDGHAPGRAGRRGIPKDVPVPKSHGIDRPEDTSPYDVTED